MNDITKLEQEVEERRTTLTPQQLVDGAFNQALINVVSTSEEVQTSLMSSAEKVIRNKTNSIEQQAQKEEKESFFNNNKGACECFGYDESTTSTWAVKLMGAWHNLATALWIIIGFVTFAPVTFVAKKITVIVKKSWIAFMLAIIIYLFVIAGIPLLTKYIGKIK